MVKQKTYDHLWEILEQVPDPEIPVINLVELGVVRKIEEFVDQDKIVVTITPTYTGGPAKKLFNDLIREKLAEHNYKNVEIILFTRGIDVIEYKLEWLKCFFRLKLFGNVV